MSRGYIKRFFKQMQQKYFHPISGKLIYKPVRVDHSDLRIFQESPCPSIFPIIKAFFSPAFLNGAGVLALGLKNRLGFIG
jgi:hypothetical protein